MVQITDLILIILFLPQALQQLLIWLYWWQDKEYRNDRFFDFLKGEDSIRKLRLQLIIFKLTFLVFFIAFPETALIYLVYIYCNYAFFKNLTEEGLRRPIFTQRAKRIIATSILFLLIPFALYLANVLGFAFALIIAELTLVYSINLGIYWTGIISANIRKKESFLARQVLMDVNPITVGITGSFGKTTTKDFVYEVLKSEFNAVKTIKNENTDLGIIRRIISAVKRKTRYFVCEMGAYKRGEIKQIANLTAPKIGILTGIEGQHLSLFGSIDNVISAKMELAESLKPGSLFLINANNKYLDIILEKAKKLRLNVYLYGQDKFKKAGYRGGYASKINVGKEFTAFSFLSGKVSRRLKTSITAPYLIENICCAILIGRLKGVSWKNIDKILLRLKTPEGTMNVLNTKKGNRIIDDSHNSTPTSFESAIEFLSTATEKQKVLVTPGIIELGDDSYLIHKRLGEKAASVFNKIILTNEMAYEPLKKGFGSGVVLEVSPKGICNEIQKILDNGNNAVLFEGRMPKMVETRFLLEK